MSGSFHLLVPVKRLVAGKSRLAAMLSPAERADLVLMMLDRVLDAARVVPAVGAISVVTDDPLVGRHVLAAGVGMVGDHGGSLNGALGAASAGLAALGVVIVHADLPWLHPEAIARLLSPIGARGCSIAADQNGHGTSALAWRGIALPALAFGPGSLRAHLAIAGAAGLPRYAILSDPAFHDIDTAADLARLDWVSPARSQAA